MKLQIYNEIKGKVLNGGDLNQIMQQYPTLQYDTLMSIIDQENSKYLRINHHKFKRKESLEQFISRYLSGDDLLEMSSLFAIPPCLLARLLMENLFAVPKSQLGLVLKDPTRLKAKANIEKSKEGSDEAEWQMLFDRFQNDLYRCVEIDTVLSPTTEIIRRVAGLEYEALLCAKVKELGIPFKTEEDLREAGFSKTPDVRFEVPIGFKGRVVTWIDSKAAFGDEYNHQTQQTEQFQKYVNRFGPGMVIYWFGFIDELNTHPEVLLIDHFPSKEEILCLPTEKHGSLAGTNVEKRNKKLIKVPQDSNPTLLQGNVKS